MIYCFFHKCFVFIRKITSTPFQKLANTQSWKEHQTCTTFDSSISFKCVVYICMHCLLLITINYMISTVKNLFQNHSEMKHLHGDFCIAFAEFPFVLRGITALQNGMNNFQASYKHNTTFHRSNYMLTIPSIMLFRFLSRPTYHVSSSIISLTSLLLVIKLL